MESNDFLHPAMMFPYSDNLNRNTNILLNGTDMILTTVINGNKTLEKQGAFNISLSNDFSNLNHLLWIKTSERADILMEVIEKDVIYRVELRSFHRLGKKYTYMLTSSSKSVCRIAPNFEASAKITIRIPTDLRNKTKINGSRSIRSSYNIQKSTFIQVESDDYLHHTTVESEDPLVVFCKDFSIFQILPMRNCGRFFHIKCPSGYSDFTVTKCNATIYTTSFESQVIAIDDMKHSVFDSWIIPLSNNEEVTIISELDVCVLITEYYSSSNKMIKTKMLSSLPASSSTGPYYATSSRFKLTTEKNEVESIKVKQTGMNDDTGREREATVPKRNSAVLSSMMLENIRSTVSSMNVSQCICTCTKFNRTFENMTFQSSLFEGVNSELKVNTSQLSSSTRRRSCAVDNRVSSQNIGYVGAVVILSTIIVIVSVDLINLHQKCCSKRKH